MHVLIVMGWFSHKYYKELVCGLVRLVRKYETIFVASGLNNFRTIVRSKRFEIYLL